MAYDYFNLKRKDEEQSPDTLWAGQQQDQPQGPQQDAPLSTASPEVKSDQGGPAKPSSSGQFTNLQSYLDSNKGFGGQVAGKVEGITDRFDQAQTGMDTGFRGQVDEETVREDEDIYGQVSAEPTTVASNRDAREAWEGMRDASYRGPQHVSDTEDLYSETLSAESSARQASEASETPGGRKAFLKAEYGRPDYTQGQVKLDQLLLQNDPAATEAFQTARGKYGEASDRWRDLQGSLNQYGQAGKATTEATRKRSRDLIGIDDAGNYTGWDEYGGTAETGGGLIGDLDRTVEGRVGEMRGAQERDRLSAETGLTERDLDQIPEYVREAILSVSGGPKHSLYKTPMEEYLGNIQLNRHNVATEDQAARMKALSSLADLENTFLPYGDLAGTAHSENLINFNTIGARRDRNARSSATDAERREDYRQANAAATEADRLTGKYNQQDTDSYGWNTPENLKGAGADAGDMDAWRDQIDSVDRIRGEGDAAYMAEKDDYWKGYRPDNIPIPEIGGQLIPRFGNERRRPGTSPVPRIPGARGGGIVGRI